MAGVTTKRFICVSLLALCAIGSTGCVSTEELYAQYDAADCRLIASTDDSGAMELHEQISNTRYPWEPAVYFGFDSSELTADENARLARSLQVLRQFPSLVIGLQGFTDKKGTSQYNRKLALERVRAVKAYLQGAGIAENRIVLQPIGEVLPQIDPNPDVARAVNRRVELMLLDDNGRPLAIEYAMK